MDHSDLLNEGSSKKKVERLRACGCFICKLSQGSEDTKQAGFGGSEPEVVGAQVVLKCPGPTHLCDLVDGPSESKAAGSGAALSHHSRPGVRVEFPA